MLSLPPELTLAILSYLPLNSLGDVSLVCHSWKKFIKIHENPIYHHAALLHGYVRFTGTSIENAGNEYSRRSVGRVINWKDLCRKRRCIERNWAGTGPSQVTAHLGAGKHVHRIKVDEKAGYILTTTTTGGLNVTDLHEDQELWSLPNSHVRPYAHCEYGQGFVIFDYIDGSKEVWRHLDDWNDEEAASVVPESMPTHRQLRVFRFAEERYETDTPPPTRGHFRPYAILRPPKTTRAFRFSYPTLGAAGWDCIYLWDVRTGALVQTIEQTQLGAHDPSDEDMTPLDLLGDINYIEVAERYVILCGIHCLRVFSRATGKVVLDISSARHPLAAWHMSFSPQRPTGKTWKGASLIPQEVVCRPVSIPVPPEVIVDEFIAAGLMLSSRLIIIHDFERALQPGVNAFDLSIEVQLGSPCFSSKYLAFEDGRISVATKTGVYIVAPDWSSISAGGGMPPAVSVFRVPALGDRMTDTGLFLNWDTDLLPVGASGASVEVMNDVFYDSLLDGRRTASVANGFSVTLVDLEEPDLDPESSSVVSVDFMASDRS
ncbi:hypothetical protein DXG01_003222 [Tephrocybe rancida]|nr:hypothetical protein DXG01_003222 [Tephrocybe rancida]